MSHQVLFVPKRRHKWERTIYLHFNTYGDIDTIQLDVPNMSVPWIQIQQKEYTRLCRMYALRQQRHFLSEEERKQHRSRSYERYRNRVHALRIELGKPLITPSGHGAPSDVIDRVVHLLRQINPKTGIPYTGIEIAIETQLSASSISRIRHGQRHESR